MIERPEGLTCRIWTVPQNLRDGFGLSMTLERLSRFEQVTSSEIKEFKEVGEGMIERPEGLTCRIWTVAQNLRDGFGLSMTLERLARLEIMMLDEIGELRKLVNGK